MFILIYSENEILKTDNEVQAFATHKEAYAEMVDQLRDHATDEEIVLEDKLQIGDLFEVSEEYLDSGRWVGYLHAHAAYLDTSEAKWAIFEVPGAFVPKDACDGFRKSIRQAADMYGDDSRSDWFDADDICQQVCWELEGYLG